MSKMETCHFLHWASLKALLSLEAMLVSVIHATADTHGGVHGARVNAQGPFQCLWPMLPLWAVLFSMIPTVT